MKNIKNIVLMLLCLLMGNAVYAQVTNVDITVTQVFSDIGDCDTDVFVANNSDPTWWWNDAPNGIDIDNQCNQEGGNNGGTFPVSLNLYNGPWVCDLSFEFFGCEGDGTGCVLGEATGVICDGPRSSTIVDLNTLISDPLPTSGSFPINACVTSSCGSGGDQYCFDATVTFTENTLPEDLIVGGMGDNICEAIPLNIQANSNDDNGYFKWCTDMTLEAGEPTSVVDGFAQGSAWFSFVAPASGNVTINTDENSVLACDALLGCGTEFAVYHAINGANCEGANSCTGTQIKDKFDYLAHVDNADLGGPVNASFYADLTLSCNGLGGDGLIPGETYYVQVSTDDPNTTGVLQVEVVDEGGGPNMNAYDVPCGAVDLDGLLSATPITNDGTVPGTIDGEAGNNCILNNGHISNITLIDQSCTHDWEIDEDNAGGVPPYAYDEGLGGGNDPDGSVWVRFTAPNSGEMFLETNICGQGEGMILYSPDPAFAPATPGSMSCADLIVDDYTTDVDAGGTFGGATAILQPNCLEPGYEYYAVLDPTTVSVLADIAVWAFDPVAAGLAPNADAAPLNDIMCLALSDAQFEVPVNTAGSCGAMMVSGDNTNACIETLAGEPSIGVDQTTWHYFTVPASGSVEINVTPGTIGQANFNVYETADGTTAGCYGGLATGGGRTFTDAGACVLTPCISGNSSAPVTKCCLNPGDVLAIQVDGSSGTGTYDIEINEIDPDAGVVTYVDPDSDSVTSGTATPTTAGPAVFCNGQTLVPTTDAIECPATSYCAAEAACDYPACLVEGFLLHDTASPTDPSTVTIYATDAPGGVAGFANDGSVAAIPTCQVIYVSPVVDGNDATNTFGDFCASSAIGDAAPVVFLTPLSIMTAAAVDGDCNVTFAIDGGLPCFDAAAEYSFELLENDGMTSAGVTGTTASGAGMLTTPDAQNYIIRVTDGEGCEIDVPVDATACTPPEPCNITNGSWSK